MTPDGDPGARDPDHPDSDADADRADPPRGTDADRADAPVGLWQEVRESIQRVDNQDSPRNRIRRITQTVWLHLHPARVARHGVRWRFTLGAGGITFFLFLITLVSGVLLMLVYRPTPEHAYADMKSLDFDVPFGMFLRNLHRWSGHAMVIMVWIHMLRVFLTGSYKPPRQFNWVVGVFLLTTTMLLAFTGYLLPWDQLSMWAVTVGTNMAGAAPLFGHEGPFSHALGVTEQTDLRAALIGGPTIGGPALLRFYVAHCIILPLGLMTGLAVHFWRIRKDGGISGPRPRS